MNSVRTTNSDSGGSGTASTEATKFDNWYSMYGDDIIMNVVIPITLVLVVIFAVYYKLRQIQTGSTGLPKCLDWLFSPVGEEASRDMSFQTTASRQQTAVNQANTESNNTTDDANGTENNDDDEENEGDILAGFRVRVQDYDEGADGVPLVSTKKDN